MLQVESTELIAIGKELLRQSAILSKHTTDKPQPRISHQGIRQSD